MSVNALVGLTAEKDGVALALISWGSGTRRLASLAIADALQSGQPITVVDEIARGLEPYTTSVRHTAAVDAAGPQGRHATECRNDIGVTAA